MPLFILETIGTSELILIGIVALIFLGPRKLPQIARTVGKMMAEFRNTTNEFKETWEREVNFEEEVKSFTNFESDEPKQATIARASLSENTTSTANGTAGENTIAPPEIRPAPVDQFNDLPAQPVTPTTTDTSANDNLSDKRNWL